MRVFCVWLLWLKCCVCAGLGAAEPGEESRRGLGNSNSAVSGGRHLRTGLHAQFCAATIIHSSTTW